MFSKEEPQPSVENDYLRELDELQQKVLPAENQFIDLNSRLIQLKKNTKHHVDVLTKQKEEIALRIKQQEEEDAQRLLEQQVQKADWLKQKQLESRRSFQKVKEQNKQIEEAAKNVEAPAISIDYQYLLFERRYDMDEGFLSPQRPGKEAIKKNPELYFGCFKKQSLADAVAQAENDKQKQLLLQQKMSESEQKKAKIREQQRKQREEQEKQKQEEEFQQQILRSLDAQKVEKTAPNKKLLKIPQKETKIPVVQEPQKVESDVLNVEPPKEVTKQLQKKDQAKNDKLPPKDAHTQPTLEKNTHIKQKVTPPKPVSVKPRSPPEHSPPKKNTERPAPPLASEVAAMDPESKNIQTGRDSTYSAVVVENAGHEEKHSDLANLQQNESRLSEVQTEKANIQTAETECQADALMDIVRSCVALALHRLDIKQIQKIQNMVVMGGLCEADPTELQEYYLKQSLGGEIQEAQTSVVFVEEAKPTFENNAKLNQSPNDSELSVQFKQQLTRIDDVAKPENPHKYVHTNGSQWPKWEPDRLPDQQKSKLMLDSKSSDISSSRLKYSEFRRKNQLLNYDQSHVVPKPRRRKDYKVVVETPASVPVEIKKVEKKPEKQVEKQLGTDISLPSDKRLRYARKAPGIDKGV